MASFRLADSLAGGDGVSYATVVLPGASGALDSADTLEVSALTELPELPRAICSQHRVEVNRLQRE